jgi:ATP-binding protein involved in chromosome partitioning
MGQGGGTEIARALGLPLIAQIPMLQNIREGGDQGCPAALGTGSVAEMFTGVAREVALSLDALQTKPVPQIIFEE